MRKIVLLLCLLTASIAFTQERNCASMESLQKRMQKDPNIARRMADIESFTQQRILQNQTNRIDGSIITIPVVVHVIYSNSNENISDAQIQSQIDVMNEDFRRTNSDANSIWSQAADTEIEFCLASTDPNGNPTSGITRKSSSKTSWGTNDAMKKSSQGGVDPWDTSLYLNMWVCNIGGGILGYAQFPGGSAATDGVVMGPQYFGSSAKGSGFYLSAPFDLGRTTTHEVGHYLNLRHIWGDGGCGVDDFVSDTPESDAANYGCSTGHSSCGTTDMVQNYMDYSDDSCMNLFTQGQKDRMRAILESGGVRRSLALSDKCGSGGTIPTCNDGIQNGDETGVDCGGSSCAPCQISCTENEVILSITFDNYPEEISWAIQNDAGQTVASSSYSSSNPDGSTVTETLCLPDDCYAFTINDSYGDGMCCAYGNGSYTLTGPNGEIKSGGSFTSSDSKDFCLGGNTPPSCINMNLSLTLDNYPEETSWKIKNNSGSVVASGGTYGNQPDGSTLNISNCLPAGCYTFTINDSYGDGICCAYGNGSYTLTNSDTGATLASGGSFGSTETKNFCLSNTRENETIRDKNPSETFSLKLFPNPASGDQLNIVTDSYENSSYRIVNTVGQVLIQGELYDVKSTININKLSSGVYFISIDKNDTTITKQFVKK